MTIGKIGVPGLFFATEVLHAEAQASVTSISISGGVATVTQTSHGYTTGQLVTFAGVTGVTALNGAHWQITSTGANTYTFPTTLTGSPAGTILAQPVTVLSYGQHFAALAANVVIEYNPDNTADINQGIGITGATWRTLIPASGSGMISTDGNAVRVRAVTTTANSYISKVE
jgi:hypothetical protein